MQDFWKESLVVIILFSIFIFFNQQFDTKLLKNVDIKPFSEPTQEIIQNGDKFEINIDGVQAKITPIATYKVYGRVLAQHYMSPKYPYSPIVPFDVAIGWKDLATKESFRYVKIVQQKRASYWITSWGTPYNCKQIQSMYSNNHLIPANKNIYNVIKKLKRKDIVYIEGYLVNAEILKNGQIENINTSLSREDAKCEVIYVTRIVTKKGDFQ